MASYTSSPYAIYNPEGELVKPEIIADELDKALAAGAKPERIGQSLKFYGINPADVAMNYNVARGTNVTPEQAYQFFGLEPPQPEPELEPEQQQQQQQQQPIIGHSSRNPIIPSDIYPTSTNTSYSGINWEGPLMSVLLPQLQQAIRTLPQTVEKYISTIQPMYSSILRSALQPEALQGTMNSLAQRGLLNSTIASDVLSQTTKDILKRVGRAAYSSILAGLGKQLDIPSILAGIGGLGKVSLSTSQQQDPLAPYRLLTTFLLG